MIAALSVLHVLAPARYGGLERVVSSVAVGQAEAGIDTRVLAIVEPDDAEHPVIMALRRDGITADALVIPPRQYLAERRGVVDWCRRTRPSVVHVHGARPDVLLSGVIRAAGFPVVTTVHGFTGGDLKNRFYEALQRRALRGMDAVIAVSRPLARELIRRGVPAHRVHLVPNAARRSDVTLSRADARAQLGIASHETVVGWVGRLTSEKGCDVFVRAMASVISAHAASASIVGSGQESQVLARLADKVGLGSAIRWHGEIPGAGRVLTAFDVFVMSSRTEGTPMVLFEAIQAGVPVVATAVGGIPDVISADDAVLVPGDDAARLAAGILEVLNDPASAARRAAVAAKRIDTAFSPGAWVERYSAVYGAVLAARQ